MKKIKKLDDLKNLDKSQLIDQMLIGTIKGGASCANITSNKQDPHDIDFVSGTPDGLDFLSLIDQ